MEAERQEGSMTVSRDRLVRTEAAFMLSKPKNRAG